jgi:F-type H+-transporting ATPase subunit delta
MSGETVARRYALALADVVEKSPDSEIVKSELKQWQAMMTANADLINVFRNPAIAHAGKEKLLENLIEKAKPARTTANFLRVLLRNNRLTEIAQINDKFASVLEERSGALAATIISARPLSAEEQAALQNNLSKLTGKNVSLNFNIDSNIIGGVVTKIGSTVYDGSVKTQLENLKEQMIRS